jgi:acyl carrier protein
MSALLGRDEQRVAAAWSEVLGENVASPEASFFELGGDSIAAMRVAAALAAELPDATDPETEILVALFETPNLRSLAQTLAAIRNGRRT